MLPGPSQASLVPAKFINGYIGGLWKPSALAKIRSKLTFRFYSGRMFNVPTARSAPEKQPILSSRHATRPNMRGVLLFDILLLVSLFFVFPIIRMFKSLLNSMEETY